jgi:hypothetical protein
MWFVRCQPNCYWGNTSQYQPNKVRSTRNYHCVSPELINNDHGHACTVCGSMHTTWGSKQTLIFQLNVVRLSRRYQGCTKQKVGSICAPARMTTQPTKCVCTFLYLGIVLNCSEFWGDEKIKFAQGGPMLFTMIFAFLPVCVTVRNMKGVCVLNLIYQAEYIQSEIF